jgi:glycosyltransferase involved in cell wall biosynthesis
VSEADISIVTVVLNDIKGLKLTIESIQRQVGIVIEHIIVDGGSLDGSQILAEQYSDVAVESKLDGGIYQGMQRGASKATAPLIMFVNSGDQVEGEVYLKRAVKHLLNSNSKWGFGPILETTSRATLRESSSLGELNVIAISKRTTYIPFPVVLIRKNEFNRLGGFSFKYRIAGDFDLIIRLAQNSLPTRWSYPLVRFAAGGISYTQPIIAWREEHVIRRENLRLIGFDILKSYLIFLKRIMRWEIGKLLDLVQSVGLFGQKHWRDRY